MAKWLASVQSLAEAQLMADFMPDILDLKNPAVGALGALAPSVVREIVAHLGHHHTISATLGDDPIDSAALAERWHHTDATGVTFLKLGCFPTTRRVQHLQSLAGRVAASQAQLIGVIFADLDPQPTTKSLIQALRQAGFSGVMVDTAQKQGQGLLKHWSVEHCQAFVDDARDQGLLVGLAGALRLEEVALLRDTGADYLGFRSALCQQRDRQSSLDPRRISRLCQTLAELSVC